MEDGTGRSSAAPPRGRSKLMADRLLDRVDTPSDLKSLSYEELEQVAQEARDTIISVITERGGHLASNLGVVELTLALHRVFESPRDSLVWDTTNQLYTHKLVTGRRDEFQNIRLEGDCLGSVSRMRVRTTLWLPVMREPGYRSRLALHRAR